MVYLNWRHVRTLCGGLLCFVLWSLWAAALPAQTTTDDAAIWGVDLQAVQTRPAHYEIQLACYQLIHGDDAEKSVTVFIQERDVMVGPSPLELSYVAYEEVEVSN